MNGSEEIEKATKCQIDTYLSDEKNSRKIIANTYFHIHDEPSSDIVRLDGERAQDAQVHTMYRRR